jgi:molybdate transport system ATP-binding protein
MSLHIAVRHTLGDFLLAAETHAEQGINVLFGPSGAGKSTLLHLIAGLVRPTAGTIALHGRTLTDVGAGVHVPPRRRRIGMVFQEPLLLPHRTALANVALAAGSGDRRARRAAALRWLDRVEVAELADRRPGQLSGGQQQRVALARALAGQPELLLLDEPFSSLDADARRRLGALVKELVADEGLTAIFVTHDRDELATLADRVLPAQPGRVHGVMSPADALRRWSPDDDDRAA